jgi:hypothetical protein
MSRNWIVFAIALAIAYPAISQSEERQVAVTARYATAKKASQHVYRLQWLPGSSGAILATGATRIPRSLKSIRFQDRTKINRSSMLQEAAVALDSTYSALKEFPWRPSYKIPSPSEYEKHRDFFLGGKRSSSYFSNQWVKLQTTSLPEKQNISFKTRGMFRTHHLYQVDYLPASTAFKFPALDPWFCEPAELKFFKLRKLQGYGVDKIKYVNYDLPKRFIIRKAFDVYFKHNDINPDPAGLTFATDYLEQNEFEILKAELEGGCSIEGTAERNSYLQNARAKALQRALHKYSSSKVKKDTMMLADAMKQFRSEVEKTKHKWLNVLSDDSILSLVNTNDSVRVGLEPIFEIQRKASLQLVIAKKLTSDEQYNKLIADMVRLSNRYHTKVSSPDTEARLMGMIEKLFEYYEDGFISADTYEEALDMTVYPGYLKILTGYHLLKRYEENTWPKEKAKSWEEYWDNYDVERWLKLAQEEAVKLLEFNAREDRTKITRILLEFNAREDRTKITRILTDFQAYTYEFIELGLIELNTLCTFIYPQTPQYLGLILNQYAFMYEMASRRNIPVDCFSSSQCVHADPSAKDSTFNIDKFIASVSKQYPLEKYDLVGDRLVKKKNYDTNPKSAYYILLKEYYLKKNTSALGHVEYTNGSGNVVFDVFNLWHLLSINVDRWNPFENHFYDSAVQIDEMDRLVGTLKKLDGNICKPQINGLYLDYYLKLLHHLQQYPEPGNPKHAKYADAALKFISNYYKVRARNVPPRLSLYLAEQLNDFNWLQGKNPGAWYGYEVLNSIANTRLLSDDEMKLYAHYLKLFNPQMKKVPKVGFEKGKLMQLWEEVY